MLKKIKRLDVDADALIEIVENENGQQLILKTSDSYDVVIEKVFTEVLERNDIPHLTIFQDKSLLDTQLLLEYIEGSPTVGKTETPELFEKWGKMVSSVHNVKNNEAIEILQDGTTQSISWNKFLSERYNTAVSKNIVTKLLSEEVVEKIDLVIRKYLSTQNEKFSLIHGDLHSNNVILRDGETILYDKGSSILYGDRCYDLAIFMISFAFGEDESDKKLTEAFIKGYGKDFFELHKERLELNSLIRAFERHGNKFVPNTGLIISNLLKKFDI